MPGTRERCDRARDRERRARGRAGVTLIELAVVLGIIGVLLLVAMPLWTRWQDDQRAKQAARAAADLLLLARSEAIRTGEQYVVYFGPPGTTDPNGAAIEKGGSYVPMLVLDDGPAATANCRIDAGEAQESIPAAQGLSWGVSEATAAAPGDQNAGVFAPPQASGHTIRDSTNTARNWLLFRPDGIPVVFTAAGANCGVVSTTGTGGGAFYITNGKRDYAIVLSPLGSVRVHAWSNQGGWTS
jgi:prepilin-type N-terminal cleavage/methylation domain-containing protein